METKGHVQDYFNEKTVTFLSEAVEILTTNDHKLEADIFCQEVEDLINYMRHHGGVAMRDLIEKVWD